MGLVRALAGLPLAPLRGVVWIAERLGAEADRQMNDPAVLRRKIDEVERAFERGEIEEPERDRQQEELLRRLVGGGPDA